eukprot:gene33561-43371_t
MSQMEAKTEVIFDSSKSPLYPDSEESSKRGMLSRSKSSVLKLSSIAIEAYCQYEALDYSETPMQLWKYFYYSQFKTEFKSEYVYPHFECGIFAVPFDEPDELKGRGLATYRFIMRWASIIWRYCIRWILVYVSRRISGISKAEDVTLVVPSEQTGETKTQPLHKCSGYYGWGKIALALDPVVVCERVRTEFTNLSIVSALFLTITVQLITVPPDAVMQYSNESSIDGLTAEIIQILYVIGCGAAVGCQIATVTTAVSMITNLNKCQGDSGEDGVMFIKSIFNPYNGLAGLIGPMLYIGSIASWLWTMWITMVTCIATYNNPMDIWAWVFILMAFIWMVFVLQLSLGIMTEFHVTTPGLDRFAKDPKSYIDSMMAKRNK